MPNSDKNQMYRNIERIADALERVASVLEGEQEPAPRDDWERHALVDRIGIFDKPPAEAITGGDYHLACLAQTLANRAVRALPEPPEHLAEAWRRFQVGEVLPESDLRALDEWRADCARDAGF